MQEQSSSLYPANTGPHAHLSEDAKKKRLDAMVRIWLTHFRGLTCGWRASIEQCWLSWVVRPDGLHELCKQGDYPLSIWKRSEN